jgi:hypothetical protein
MRAVALLAVVTVACGGASDLSPQPPMLAPAGPGEIDEEIVGLAPGESLAFELKVAGVLAGQAQLAVGAPGLVDGRRAIAVSSVMRTAGAFALIKEVKDEVTSYIDLEQLRPIRSTSDVIFGPRRYHAETTFSDHGVAIDFRPEGQPARTIQYDFGEAVVHDAHSAMALVRTWKAEPGERMGLWVIGGRRIWRTEVWLAGTRLDGTSVRTRPDLAPEKGKTPRSFSVWLSDDADRVPLRFSAKTELGEISIDLVHYERP